MKKVETSMKQWLAIFVTILCYYLVHEGIHLVVALILGNFEQIRMVGLIGIQIVTTEGSMSGLPLVIFSGLSSLVTIGLGYLLALHPSVYQIKSKPLLIGLYYITICFLLLDPIYISVLSTYVGGGDLNGIITGLGNVSEIPFKVVFGIIAIVNLWLFRQKVHPKYKVIFNEK